MSVNTFRAMHCGETFEGATGVKALEAHMKAHRSAKRGTYFVPDAQPSHAPTPWKAPRVPNDAEGTLARIIAASDDAWMIDGPTWELGYYSNHPPFAKRGDFICDAAPLDALPPTVAKILSATIERGEVWLVRLKGDGAFVQVATEVTSDAIVAEFDIWRGKVRAVRGRGIVPNREGRFTSDATMTHARAAFGSDAVREPRAA